MADTYSPNSNDTLVEKDISYIKAVYETKREQLMLGWLNPNTREYIDDAYAYAYSQRMFPFFHEEEKHETDPFADVYDIKRNFIDEVTEYLDEFDRMDESNPERQNLNFASMEDKFGGYRNKRVELIVVLRYCFLSDRFMPTLYETILKNSPPVEVQSFNRPIEELSFTLG